MNNDKKVKKTLQWGSATIKLYEVDEKNVPFEGCNNLEAFGMKGEMLWTAEFPKSRFDFYRDIRIDTADKVLLAYTAISFLAKISLESGKTVDFSMIK
jgi:hypothetical protein